MSDGVEGGSEKCTPCTLAASPCGAVFHCAAQDPPATRAAEASLQYDWNGAGCTGVTDLERRMVSLVEGLRARHRREVMAMDEVERPQGLAPHASSGTLQRRRQEVALAGLQRYGGAHMVQPFRPAHMHASS